MPLTRPKIVIVGAGFGGLEAAKRLAHEDVDVTVIDRRNHHLFQPLLYQVATAALSPADIAAPIRSILAKARNVRVLLDSVCAVVPSQQAVRLQSGAVVPYDKVWRTGANEATVLTFDRDMTIGGAQLPAGAYSLWTIPKADGTVQLIINRQHGQWGTSYDPAQDVVRVPMKASTAPAPQENFAIDVPGSGTSGELRISWDVFVWSVPLTLK